MEIAIEVFAGLVMFRVAGAIFAALVARGEQVKFQRMKERWMASEEARLKR